MRRCIKWCTVTMMGKRVSLGIYRKMSKITDELPHFANSIPPAFLSKPSVNPGPLVIARRVVVRYAVTVRRVVIVRILIFVRAVKWRQLNREFQDPGQDQNKLRKNVGLVHVFTGTGVAEQTVPA